MHDDNIQGILFNHKNLVDLTSRTFLSTIKQGFDKTITFASGLIPRKEAENISYHINSDFIVVRGGTYRNDDINQLVSRLKIFKV